MKEATFEPLESRVLLSVAMQTMDDTGGEMVMSSATRMTVASGDWSDAATWMDGIMPTTGDSVMIDPAHSVVYDQSDPSLFNEVMIGGTLIFDSLTSLHLNVEGNVVVHGQLQMLPGSHSVEHKLTFNNVDESAFVGGGHEVLATDVGLWVMHGGILNTIGSTKTPWTRLAGSAFATDAVIEVQDAAGWQVGDRLEIVPTVAPSAGASSWNGYDSRTILAINGNEITLSSPLTYDHPQVNEQWTAEVLNLTRNVVIEGTEAGRAHVALMHFMNPQTIRNIEIRHMGLRQADGSYTASVLGRYGLHFHHGGDNARGSLVENVVVHSSGAHAFVPHASHGMTFTGTVTHDTFDDAYWWDSGVANATHDLVWTHAVASLVKSDPTFRGYRLTGFNLGQGDNNTMTNSVAVGVRGNVNASGFIWPEGSHSVWTFNNNIGHNNKIDGIFTWQNNANNHIVEDFAMYHNGKAGVEHGAYRNSYTYRNAVLYGNGQAGFLLHATSNGASALTLDNILYDGADISTYGLQVVKHTLAPGQPAMISNSHFQNITGSAVAFTYVGDPENTHDEKYLLVNNTFEDGLNRFYLSDAIRPGSVITVQMSHEEIFELRRADQSGDLVTQWNARRTDLPAWTLPQEGPVVTVTETFTGNNGDAWPEHWEVTGLASVSIQNNEGEIRYNASGATAFITMRPPQPANEFNIDSLQEVTLRASVSTSGMRGGLMARRADDSPNDYYAADLAVLHNVGRTVRIGRVINGSFVTLATLGSGTHWEIGVDYQLKFNVEQVDFSATLLQVKYWESGTEEPANWTLEFIDTDTSLQNRPGTVGILGGTNSSSARFWRFDNHTAQIGSVPMVTEDFTGVHGSDWSSQWLVESNNQSVTINNNMGEMRHNARGSNKTSSVAALDPVGVDAYQRDSTQEVTLYSSTSTTHMSAGLIARRTDDAPTTYYAADLAQVHKVGRTVQITRVVDGSETVIATLGAGNFWDIQTNYQLKFNVEQQGSQTLLQVKVWQAGTAEPDQWTLETTDNHAALQDIAGRVGLRSTTVSSAARYWLFDNYTAILPAAVVSPTLAEVQFVDEQSDELLVATMETTSGDVRLREVSMESEPTGYHDELWSLGSLRDVEEDQSETLDVTLEDTLLESTL